VLPCSYQRVDDFSSKFWRRNLAVFDYPPIEVRVSIPPEPPATAILTMMILERTLLVLIDEAKDSVICVREKTN